MTSVDQFLFSPVNFNMLLKIAQEQMIRQYNVGLRRTDEIKAIILENMNNNKNSITQEKKSIVDINKKVILDSICQICEEVKKNPSVHLPAKFKTEQDKMEMMKIKPMTEIKEVLKNNNCEFNSFILENDILEKTQKKENDNILKAFENQQSSDIKTNSDPNSAAPITTDTATTTDTTSSLQKTENSSEKNTAKAEEITNDTELIIQREMKKVQEKINAMKFSDENKESSYDFYNNISNYDVNDNKVPSSTQVQPPSTQVVQPQVVQPQVVQPPSTQVVQPQVVQPQVVQPQVVQPQVVQPQPETKKILTESFFEITNEESIFNKETSIYNFYLFLKNTKYNLEKPIFENSPVHYLSNTELLDNNLDVNYVKIKNKKYDYDDFGEIEEWIESNDKYVIEKIHTLFNFNVKIKSIYLFNEDINQNILTDYSHLLLRIHNAKSFYNNTNTIKMVASENKKDKMVFLEPKHCDTFVLPSIQENILFEVLTPTGKSIESMVDTKILLKNFEKIEHGNDVLLKFQTDTFFCIYENFNIMKFIDIEIFNQEDKEDSFCKSTYWAEFIKWFLQKDGHAVECEEYGFVNEFSLRIPKKFNKKTGKYETLHFKNLSFNKIHFLSGFTYNYSLQTQLLFTQTH